MSYIHPVLATHNASSEEESRQLSFTISEQVSSSLPSQPSSSYEPRDFSFEEGKPDSFKQSLVVHPVYAIWGIKAEDLEAVFKQCKQLVCVIDNAGKFKKINTKWHEILGWEIDELINTSYMQLLHPEDKEQILALEKNRFHSSIIRLRTKYGSYRWLEWIELPYLGTAEKQGTPICFAQDVTFKKEFEKEHKKKFKAFDSKLGENDKIIKAISEIQSKHMLEMLTTGNDLLVKNRRTLEIIIEKYIHLSHSDFGFMGEITYNEKNQPVLLHVWKINSSTQPNIIEFYKSVEDKSILCKIKYGFLKKLYLEKKPSIFHDVSFNFKIEGSLVSSPLIERLLGIPFIVNNEVVGILGLANPLQSSHQGILEMLNSISIFCANIVDQGRIYKKSESKRLEQEAALSASSEAKSNFVAHMSHEIRTPLTGLLGMMDLLDTSYFQEKDKKYLMAAKEAGSNLLGILNDILDLSKIEAKQFTLETILFSPIEMLEKLKERYVPQAKSKDLDLDFHVDAQVPAYISGDPTRLRQILTNLLSNAVKFTEKGSISCNLGGHFDSEKQNAFILEGRITDTGIGIPHRTQAHLFMPFVQGDASITRKFGGTGLGLYITKQLCELMGGSLGVKSVPSKGSTFYFNVCLPLPLSSSEVGTSETSGGKEEKIGLLPALRILIAEDNKLSQKVLRTILTREGCKVTVVENGLQAVQAVQEDIYDLVLMDGQMPEMDGLEATRQIRQIFDDQTLPIIGVTAHALESHKQKFLTSGMNGYLTKPIQKELLKAEILRCIKQTVTYNSKSQIK